LSIDCAAKQKVFTCGNGDWTGFCIMTNACFFELASAPNPSAILRLQRSMRESMQSALP